jgi:hypothetical protein
MFLIISAFLVEQDILIYKILFIQQAIFCRKLNYYNYDLECRIVRTCHGMTLRYYP